VAEQPDSYAVVFRCDRCARRSGRAPVLAVGNPDPSAPVEWSWRLWARRASHPLPPMEKGGISSHGGGVPHGSMRRLDTRGRQNTRLALIPLMAPAAQLICHRCKAKPRVARAKLVELAEQAMAAGRRDAYV